MWSNDHPSNYKKAIIWLIPNMPVKCLLSLCVKLNARINEFLYISGVITCDSQALVGLRICFYYSLVVGLCNQTYFLCALPCCQTCSKFEAQTWLSFGSSTFCFGEYFHHWALLTHHIFSLQSFSTSSSKLFKYIVLYTIIQG